MTSRAIRQYEFGPAENLLFEEVPAPVPGPGQVRVAVAAAGVHLIDTSIRKGVVGGPFPLPRLPMTPGREVAGVVDVVGDGVGSEWLGRRVVAHLGQASGGYAELAVAPVRSLHEVPVDLPFGQAVAMIGTGRTVLAVLEMADLKPDDVVVVSAAAGGMGALLVQAAKNVGAYVVGLAGGPEKVALVRGLGADEVVDYRGDGWLAALGSTGARGGGRGAVAQERAVVPGGAVGRAPVAGSGGVEGAGQQRVGVSSGAAGRERAGASSGGRGAGGPESTVALGGMSAVGRVPTVVLDGVGGAVGRRLFELLGRGGRLVAYGASGGEFTRVPAEELAARDVTLLVPVGAWMAKRGLRGWETAALAAAGRGEWQALTTEFPLSGAAEAHAALEARGTVGKVVLVP
jgi:NADPH2:quinone reductase